MLGHLKSKFNRLQTFVTQHRRFTLALYASAMTVGCVLLYDSLRAMEDRRIQLEFTTECERATSQLSETLDVYHEIVESIASFHVGNSGFSRDQFSSFVERAITKYPNIQALEWIPKVPASDRESIERAAQSDGVSDFHFKKWTDSGEWVTCDDDWAENYYPIFYVQPTEKNQNVIGLDLGSNPVRRAVFHRAAELDLPVAIAGSRLVPENSSQAVFLLFVPVFEDAPTLPQQQRGQELCGFALGVFRIKDILNDSLNLPDKRPFHLQMKDSEGKILYPTTKSGAFNEHFSAESLHKNPVGCSHVARCEFGGQSWSLEYSSKESWLNSQRASLGLSIFAGGTTLSLLLGAFLWIVTERTAHVEKLVSQRTLELENANKLICDQRDQLKVGQTILKESNQQLKEFAYAASHDLQTPLRGMASYAQFLKEDFSHCLNSEGNQYLNGILDSADRMQLLISELLEYSQVESQEDSMQPTDLNIVVADVMLLLHTEIKSAAASVTCDSLPTVVCDPKQMAQLFRNLLTNALKYRSNKSLKVDIFATRTDVLSISVQDNGIGIAKQFQSKIFDIFRRLHSQSEYPGTGIGLALCRRIAQRHGGTISVNSQEGEGCRFTFTIPRPSGTSPPFHFSPSDYTNSPSPNPLELPPEQADLNCQFLAVHS